MLSAFNYLHCHNFSFFYSITPILLFFTDFYAGTKFDSSEKVLPLCQSVMIIEEIIFISNYFNKKEKYLAASCLNKDPTQTIVIQKL